MTTPTAAPRFHLGLACAVTLAGLLGSGTASAQATETAMFSPPGLQTDDRFATTLALWGDVAVLGAPNTDPPGTQDQGSAYVYEFDGTTWNLEAALFPDSPQNNAHFGSQVDIEGDRLIVSSPLRNALTGQGSSGVVHVFEKVGCCWTLLHDVLPVDAAPLDGVGGRLLLRGDRIFASALGHNGPNGTTDGAVFVLTFDGTTWSQEDLLLPNVTGFSNYGTSIGANETGELLFVGGRDRVDVWELQGGTWTRVQTILPDVPTVWFGAAGTEYHDGRLFVGDSAGPGAEGSVHVYEHDGSAWSEVATLTAPTPTASEFFGINVTAVHETILVSTLEERVYVLDKQTSGWVHREVITSANTTPNSNFGSAVDVWNMRALIGAPSQELGGGGPPFTEGAAFVFDLGSPPTDSYCSGKVNSIGCVPFLQVEGIPSPTISTTFRVRAFDTIPGEAGYLVYGFKKANLNFHGGKLCVKAPFQRWLPPKIAANKGNPPCAGVWTRNFNALIRGGTDPQLTAGQRVFVQLSQRDTADPAGFGDSLTDAATFLIAP